MKELCCICSKNLYWQSAYSCDTEPCTLEGMSSLGILCTNCANAHSTNTNHQVTKIK
jgi:hypothetical protein